MTPAERTLLREVFRWAIREGIQQGTHARWTRRGPVEHRWGVSLDFDRLYLTVWRGRCTGRDYLVTSIAEAVDVLVALGVLPPRFSTAYRAGWDWCYWRGLATSADAAPIEPAAPRELVRA